MLVAYQKETSPYVRALAFFDAITHVLIVDYTKELKFYDFNVEYCAAARFKREFPNYQLKEYL